MHCFVVVASGDGIWQLILFTVEALVQDAPASWLRHTSEVKPVDAQAIHASSPLDRPQAELNYVRPASDIPASDSMRLYCAHSDDVSNPALIPAALERRADGESINLSETLTSA